MAAPTYATDLLPVDLAEAVTNWAESTDANWDDGGGPTADTDFPFIQGNVAITQTMTKATICSLLANYGSGITLPTDGAYLVWQIFTSPVLDSYANGGMRVMVGSSLADFYSWDVGGNDFGRYPYGGWMNHALNPAIGSPDDTVGSPSGTQQYIGAAAKVTAGVGKGNIHGVDAIRWGRAEARFTDGDGTSGYCTFAGFAAVNDVYTARWGLIQAIAGGYLWKGLMTIGYSTSADFRDSDVNIYIDNTPKVTSGFNKIEVRQSGTRLDWTRVNFTSLGTVSPGAFEMIDSADVNLLDCSFTGMGTFVFLSTGEALGCVWLRCGQITAPGISMLGSKVLLSTVASDASAVVWDVNLDTDGKLDDMTFSKGSNAHHALTLGTTSPTEVTLRGWTTSGFNASNGQNDSTIYVARTSGTVTINVVGGTGNFSYKTAGATVSVVIDPVTATFTVKDPDDAVIVGARVLVEAGDGTGDLPFEDSVTITRSGTTASVSHTAHGLANGAWVVIRGANQQEYNGPHQISNVTTNAYDYTVSGAPATPATGTITSTGAVCSGTTNGSGQISGSRTYTVDQNIRGSVRKSTTAPFYKAVEFTDTIDNVNGLAKTIQMALDQ